MQQLQFQTTIQAPVQKVYETMLGLTDKATYEYWTSTFNPTSTYEGNWASGSKILFVGVDEKGKKGGMVSEVMENQPSKKVIIRHYGFLDGDTEITTGEQVEQWSGGKEIYEFDEKENITIVTVTLDTIDDFVDFFSNTYPIALQKLKDICEK